MPPQPASWDVLTRPQRIFIGIVVLLGVDLIWVGSSELTTFIFKDMSFSKPFFSTYFKTSLFMLYLTGFLLYKPWRQQCGQWDAGAAEPRAQEVHASQQFRRRYE